MNTLHQDLRSLTPHTASFISNAVFVANAIFSKLNSNAMEYPYIFKQLRPLILFIFDYRCVNCESFRTDLQVDHIDGNKLNNDPLNLQPLCRTCHDYKTKFKINYHLVRSKSQVQALARIKRYYKAII